MDTLEPSLGIGPMSRRTVDAVIHVATRRHMQLMLVASRRQVQSSTFGGGYVETWTTDEFADYVRRRAGREFVILCRDHGGPWQHPKEFSLPSEQAVITSALGSIEADIAAGFELIHIDTSVGPDGPADTKDAIRRLVVIYGGAWERARSLGRNVAFEVGFESQGREVGSSVELSEMLDEVLHQLAANGLPRPRFVVAQTGTKVMEARNVGDLAKEANLIRSLRSIRGLAKVCHRRGVLLKAHNADYLHESTWRQLIDAGADALNVAPQFGVLETRTLLRSMRALGYGDAADEIVEIAVASNRWSSWTDAPHSLSYIAKAELAGHYVFSHPRVQQLRNSFDTQLSKLGIPDTAMAELVSLVERCSSSTFID